MSLNVKFEFVFSLKHIYKRTYMLKKVFKSVQKCPNCPKKSKTIQKCPNISNQNLHSFYNLTLNKKDTYVF